MTTVPVINQGSTYFAGAGLADAISQISSTAAIAPFIQTTHGLVSFHTSDPPGPGSDHNLLDNSDVLLFPDTGDITELNSLSFKDGVMVPPVAGSLWLNSSNNHLYHGLVDLEATSGTVSTTGAPVSGNSIPRYNGTSGNFIEESPIIANPLTTQFYGAGGPLLSLQGIQLPNPAGVVNGPVLQHYSTSFVVASYTGPYITPPGDVLLLLERIGNIVNVTVASGLSAIADAAAPAAIVTTTPVPIGYRPTIATKIGTLGIITDNVYQMGSWYMDTTGILTIRPSLDPSSQFAAPVAGTSGVLSFVTFSYTIRN